jgi:hypothetical protein
MTVETTDVGIELCMRVMVLNEDTDIETEVIITPGAMENISDIETETDRMSTVVRVQDHGIEMNGGIYHIMVTALIF